MVAIGFGTRIAGFQSFGGGNLFPLILVVVWWVGPMIIGRGISQWLAGEGYSTG